MGLPVAELRSRIAEAGLLTAEEVRTFETSLAGPPADAEAFAKELVRAKRLTSYQAQALLQNKAKSLVLGDYVVLDKLGQGGMGMVLKAEHRRMKRVVALKVLSPNLTRTAAAVARFHREVQAAARLNHPHVVTAFDAGEAKGVHYLVMEFVDGKDLSALVKSVGPMAVDDAVRCIRQAALGLQYAHENGVVHRDIKPGNLLLDKSGHVKILDMGLARIDDPESKGEELTASGQIMGTAEYMSPEQALNTKLADARSDVYSLGVTLWYLLTGRPLYGGTTVMEKLLAHRDAPIPSLVEVLVARAAATGGPSQPLAETVLATTPSARLTAVEALFRRMVAKSPADRPQTMAEVVASLDRCLTEPEGPARGGASESSDSRLNAFLRHMGGPPESVGSLSPRTVPPSRGPNPGPGLEDLVRKLPGVPEGETQGDRSTKSQTGAAPAAGPDTTRSRSRRGGRRRRGLHDRRVQVGGGVALAVVLVVGIVVAVRGWKPGPSPRGGETQPAKSAGATRIPPPIAQSPFDANQAKAHQEAWAKYLGEPVETTNSIGMRFVVIPPGKFVMGAEAVTAPVELTRPFRLEIHEVTQAQWRAVMETVPWSGLVPDEDAAAASFIAHAHAERFCAKLTERERALGRLADGEEYRLPTEAEWEWACRAGTSSVFSFGDDELRLGEFAWYDKNAKDVGRSHAHAVRQKEPNSWGLYDMHGNVWEWCADQIDPVGGRKLPGGRDPVQRSGDHPVQRGGSWADAAFHCTSAHGFAGAGPNSPGKGFRVARTVSGPRTPTVAVVPPLPTAPFREPEAKDHQQAWAKHLREPVETTNSIGMKFVVVPPGKFQMGEGKDAVEVELTRPFRLGMHEVTQGQYRSVTGTEPWKGQRDVLEENNAPATYVSWTDATEFCAKLTERERASGRLGPDETYRLPTEAEWEWACRAGTTTAYSFGDDAARLGEFAWYDVNAKNAGEHYAHAVGLKQSNAWGLFDMHGNVVEWCGDWHGDKLPGGRDPVGPSQGSYREDRGGSWSSIAGNCRSAYRSGLTPERRNDLLGFRVARSSVR